MTVTSQILSEQRARVKHLLGFELPRSETLAVAIVQQLIHFRPGFLKTPKIDVWTRDGLLFLPQGAIPERSLMDALPLEPLVAFLF